MSENLVEIHFDYSHNFKENILTNKELKLLQSICSKPVLHEQLSQLHEERKETTIWNDKDKNEPNFALKIDKYYIGGHGNIVPLTRLLALNLPLRFSVTSTIKELPEYKVED